YFVGARYGWRWMFVVGGTPALLVTFIRYGVRESEAWRTRVAERHRPRLLEAFGKLFSTTYARRTILNSIYLLVSIVGLWAGSVYVPASVTQIAVREGYSLAGAARLASYATMLLSAGTILGCIVLPPLAEALGRRVTLATSVGRFAGAGITFLVGAGVAHLHTIGIPVALTSIAFLIGIALLPFGEETRGKPLPA